MNQTLLLSVLMLFVTLTCATKLSLWRWWQRFAFSAALAAFVVWSQRYAVLQSKTQLADLLSNVEALQNMAVLVTIESAVNFAFCLHWFSGSEERRVKSEEFDSPSLSKSSRSHSKSSRFTLHSALKYYPSLLLFPVAFYVLTQSLFVAVGVDFALTTAVVALAAFILPPLLAEGMKWFVGDADGRVEVLLLLSCLVCVLGLASTVTSKMVYRASDTPPDWRMVALALGVFVILFVAGYLGAKLKWRFRRDGRTAR